MKQSFLNTIYLSAFTLSLFSTSILPNEKPIVVIIPSYNNEEWALHNIKSASSQRYSNYRIIYIDDCSSDSTLSLIDQFIHENHMEEKITLIHNENRIGALENLYRSIHSCNDNEIIVTLDGDDWFAHNNVLKRINQEYQDPAVWLTYGQFIFYPSMKKGFCAPIPDEIIDQNAFRSYQWTSSHLRTFYAGLFKKIKKDDLQIDGHFYQVSWDQAMLLPMLEMAGHHIRLIPDILYIYNYNNPLNDEKTSLPLVLQTVDHIRAKPSYEKLQNLNLLGSDLIIFSYDRPLQLQALLESIEKNISGIESMHVMYRASNEKFELAYKKLAEQFKDIEFILQKNPPYDFKMLLLTTLNNCKSPYLMFAVDDIVITQKVDLKECIEKLEQYGAYGFYLRMGSNLDYCYTLQQPQSLPEYEIKENNYLIWQFNQSMHDWAYPHTVDMTIYRKLDILPFLQSLHYWSPNTLEGEWAGHANAIMDQSGICFFKSAIVNLPINQVNTSPNIHMNWKSTDELLDFFNRGLKIDIQALQNIDNKSAHMSFKPTFIKR